MKIERYCIAALFAFAQTAAYAQIAPSPTPPLNGLPGQASGPLGPDGRIPGAQLPASAFEYKGAWDAATNTPTLANGTGVVGDTYLISVSGSQDLGGGSVSYTAGNLLIYNGSTYDQITENIPNSANPSANIGLAPVNGAATTYMRSDAAPALSQGISPVWTGTHTFSNATTFLNTATVTQSSGNGIVLTPNIASSPPSISTAGANANINLNVNTKGTGSINLNSSTVVTGQFTSTQSGGNSVVLTPSASGGVPSISSDGVNANVSLDIGTKGSGGINLNSSTVIAPSGSAQLSVTSSDIAAGTGYTPANAQSLATKAYVDAATGGGPTLASGTYTPTITVSSCGCSATASGPLAYSQVGTVVSVSGTFDVTPTGTGTKGFIISLPVATTLSSGFQVNGVTTITDWSAGTINGSGIVYGNSNGSANTGVVYWDAVNTNRQLIRVVFDYTVQ